MARLLQLSPRARTENNSIPRDSPLDCQNRTITSVRSELYLRAIRSALRQGSSRSLGEVRSHENVLEINSCLLGSFFGNSWHKHLHATLS